jgi:protein-tyrosine phosphatase/membrane-associated phospholipid phosphatase
MTRLALTRSAFLSMLFLTVYGGCNWLADQRTHVGVWYFDWERQLPFWPAMIVPYLSIDAFFIVAPFLCRDRDELRLYARRISAAVVIAGVCFLLMPLRYAFERPVIDGWLGTLFHVFTSLDRPFNLFPSLHVTLAVILADGYWRHTKGIPRLLVASWFVLIGASTVLTYQHHVIDVAGGLALATVVFYAVRQPVARQVGVRNIRLAGYYFLGTLAAIGLAFASRPWGVVLLWPAVSLAVVGSAYLGAGPAVYCKSNGAIGWSARVLLWPCLLGQWISHAYYRRQCRPFDEIAPGVLIGCRLRECEAVVAIQRGVTAVLDLTAELDETHPFRRLRYRNLQVLDLTAPTLEQLDEGVRFIRRNSRHGIVYVHCKAGYSRTAAMAGSYLLREGRARTTDEAVAILRKARPSIVIRPEAELAIRQFEAAMPGVRKRRSLPPSIAATIVSALAAAVARLICGQPNWNGCEPSARQRIYFANHTSHLDFLILWGSLPAAVRVRTRPVAGRDYWERSAVRQYLARHMLRAVLVNRCEPNSDRPSVVAAARQSVERVARALSSGASLIIFPEGTRGSGGDVQPFKSGLYHLCRLRPDVELVPVYLEDLHRILPKGESIPLPLAGSVTFGRPLRLQPGEEKHAFLARAHAALTMVNRPCTYLPTLISRAS